MLTDGDRRLYRAVHGTSLVEQPEETTPCEATLLLAADADGESGADLVYEIPDAYLDDAYAETGLTIGGHVYRFYAGTPLMGSDGQVLGTLFVADAETGRLDAAQRDALAILGRQAVARLELTAREREMARASQEQRRTDTALAVERNFVSAVLDTVDALVAVFDTAGRIVRFNRACEAISGMSRGAGGEVCVGAADSPGRHRSGDAGVREHPGGAYPAVFENFWQTREGSCGGSRGRRRLCWIRRRT